MFYKLFKKYIEFLLWLDPNNFEWSEKKCFEYQTYTYFSVCPLLEKNAKMTPMPNDDVGNRLKYGFDSSKVKCRSRSYVRQRFVTPLINHTLPGFGHEIRI